MHKKNQHYDKIKYAGELKGWLGNFITLVNMFYKIIHFVVKVQTIGGI